MIHTTLFGRMRLSAIYRLTLQEEINSSKCYFSYKIELILQVEIKRLQFIEVSFFRDLRLCRLYEQVIELTPFITTS